MIYRSKIVKKDQEPEILVAEEYAYTYSIFTVNYKLI
jgi:hypothetical protein